MVGFVDRSDPGLHNAAALIRDGRVLERYHKIQLPNYGVFDEKRYFVPGTAACAIRLASSELGLSVCEDAWHGDAPFDEYARPRRRSIVNINGSPYHRGKVAEREEICRARARQTGAWIVYVNAVGGQDELVFDGGSMVVAPDGQVVAPGRDVRGGPRRRGRRRISTAERRSSRTGTAWPADRARGGLPGARARPRRLRPEERVPRGGDRPLGRDRLGARRHARRRRARARRRPRCWRCRRRTPRPRASRTRSSAPRRLGVADRHRPDHDVFDAYRRTLADLFAGTDAGRRRGEPPGADPRQPADGAVEQVRLARARHREQERVRGGLRHALRRHGRRVRADQGRARRRSSTSSPPGGTRRARRRRRSPSGS